MNASCITALISLAVLVSCSDSQPSSGAPAGAATAAATAPGPTARATFKTRCTPCHGETGHGDGPFAAKLTPKPPNFADAAWQQGVTDDELRRAIVGGGPAVGKGSAMPAVHELEGKPELAELVAIVRGFTGR